MITIVGIKGGATSLIINNLLIIIGNKIIKVIKPKCQHPNKLHMNSRSTNPSYGNTDLRNEPTSINILNIKIII